MKDEFKEVKPEKFKKYKKGQLGSWQKFNPDGGNVGMGISMFNNASTPQGSPNTSPVGGGLGEALTDEDKVKYNELFKELTNSIVNSSDSELCSNLNVTDHITDGPMFVLPNGLIVDSEGLFAYEDEAVHFGILAELTPIAKWDDTHDVDIDSLCDEIYSGRFGDGFDEFIDEFVCDYLMDERGWVRLNTGTRDVDNRYYMVLPKKRPTNAQFSVIEDFVNEGYDDEQQEVIVYIEDSKYHPTSKVYSYEDYIPEDIVKNIKRYYTSGVLYETIAPQEQLINVEDVESLKDWLKDVIEYNIESEWELGDGRYVVYASKDSHGGGHKFLIVDEVNGTPIAEETTFGKVAPNRINIVVDAISNYIIKDIEKYDNSIIGDSTLKEIKEKCLKAIDNNGEGVIMLEKVGSYEYLACEYNKKSNKLWIYNPNSPMIDLYRGNLK